MCFSTLEFMSFYIGDNVHVNRTKTQSTKKCEYEYIKTRLFFYLKVVNELYLVLRTFI